MKALRNYMMMLLAAVLAVACTNNDYQVVIPKNANFVASFNFKNLFEDIDIPEETTNNLKSLMGMAFSGQDRDNMEEFLDGKTSFGIDFSEPVLAFSAPDCPLGISMKVDNEDNIDKLIELLIRQDLCKKVKEKDGFKWTTLLGDFRIAYNGSSILICGDVNENDMKKLFDNNEENSFVTTPDFERLTKKESPLSVFLHFASMEGQENLPLINELLPEGVKLSDTSLLTDLVMEKGHADINAEIYSNKENVQALLEEADKNFQKIHGDFIKAPANFLAWFGMGVKGEDLLKKLKSNDEINGMMMMVDRAIDLQKIIKTMDGDLAIVMPQMNDAGNPDVVLTAKLKNEDFLKDVDYWQEQMKDWNIKMVENDKNEFTLFLDEESQDGIKWGVDDKNVYFTSQNTSYKKTFADTNPLLDEQAEDIKNSILYLCVNLNPVFDSVKDALRQQMGDMAEVINKIEYPFDKFVVKANNARSCTLSISLKDKNKNVINALFELYGQVQDMALNMMN